jgi:L-fuconolactonase
LTIDAHHHLWKFNELEFGWMNAAMSTIRRDFLIPELEQVARDSGIDGTVVVQATQTTEETEWLLSLAAESPLILGVVGWAPLASPDADSRLERFAHHPKFKGVRHVLQDEPDDSYMLRKDFGDGISLLRNLGLAYDVVIFERHLPQTIEFVDRHPGQVFVIDHMAKPEIRSASLLPWRERITELAKRENVFCKVSGMATEADWKTWNIETLRPYFDVVLAAFGARRLMFGSDWPVVNLAGGYGKWISCFRSLIAELSSSEQQEICRGTAITAYRL